MDLGRTSTCMLMIKCIQSMMYFSLKYAFRSASMYRHYYKSDRELSASPAISLYMVNYRARAHSQTYQSMTSCSIASHFGCCATRVPMTEGSDCLLGFLILGTLLLSSIFVVRLGVLLVGVLVVLLDLAEVQAFVFVGVELGEVLLGVLGGELFLRDGLGAVEFRFHVCSDLGQSGLAV